MGAGYRGYRACELKDNDDDDGGKTCHHIAAVSGERHGEGLGTRASGTSSCHR